MTGTPRQTVLLALVLGLAVRGGAALELAPDHYELLAQQPAPSPDTTQRIQEEMMQCASEPSPARLLALKEEVDKLHRKYPTSATAASISAAVASLRGEHEEAIVLQEKVLMMLPTHHKDSLRVRLELAKSYAALHRYATAEMLLSDMIKRCKSLPDKRAECDSGRTLLGKIEGKVVSYHHARIAAQAQPAEPAVPPWAPGAAVAPPVLSMLGFRDLAHHLIGWPLKPNFGDLPAEALASEDEALACLATVAVPLILVKADLVLNGSPQLALLRQMRAPYLLMTHESDHALPDSNPHVRSLLDDPLLVRWWVGGVAAGSSERGLRAAGALRRYMQNCDVHHPKAHAVPIGAGPHEQQLHSLAEAAAAVAVREQREMQTGEAAANAARRLLLVNFDGATNPAREAIRAVFCGCAASHLARRSGLSKLAEGRCVARRSGRATAQRRGLTDGVRFLQAGLRLGCARHLLGEAARRGLLRERGRAQVRALASGQRRGLPSHVGCARTGRRPAGRAVGVRRDHG